jgi:hypothetical protein
MDQPTDQASDKPKKPERQYAPPLTPGDYFVDTKEAARILCLAEDTLVTWRNRKEDGPPFYPMAKNKVVYLRSELIAWGRQYRVGPIIAPLKPGQPPRPWES